MKLPTLYSRTSTGAVQIWEIEIDGPRYRAISGQIDGKKVTAEWTVCGPKNVGRANATTAEQQAESEARAKWKKKLDGGYRESQDQIDSLTFIEPMLAKSFDDLGEALVYPVFSQPKYDGIRCVVRKDGMYSRAGKVFTSAPHIMNALKGFFDDNPDATLDGELYSAEFADDFNAICSLVKRSKLDDSDLATTEQKLQYWIYDLYSKEDFSLRTAWLQKNIPQHKSLVLVPTAKVNERAELDALYEKYMETGHEGQMVRIDGPYEHKRSRLLLKRKDFLDSEYEIVDVVEGDGNRSGMAGSMVLRRADGVLFSSNIKGDRKYMRKLMDDKSALIGKSATVKYFNLTPDGIPRFPYVVAIRDYE